MNEIFVIIFLLSATAIGSLFFLGQIRKKKLNLIYHTFLEKGFKEFKGEHPIFQKVRGCNVSMYPGEQIFCATLGAGDEFVFAISKCVNANTGHEFNIVIMAVQCIQTGKNHLLGHFNPYGILRFNDSSISLNKDLKFYPVGTFYPFRACLNQIAKSYPKIENTCITEGHIISFSHDIVYFNDKEKISLEMSKLKGLKELLLRCL